MIFPSHIFLLVFFPTVLLAWHAMRSVRARLAFLTVASYLFYGWWDYRFTVLMLGSTLLDYVCGRALGATRAIRDTGDDKVRRRRKLWLALSVTGNLTALGFFKYYGFFADSMRDLTAALGIPLSAPLLDVVLPVGISFYTFQSMSYTISIYRGTCRPADSFLHFAAFVSMFPQLVAGPIVRYTELEPQLRSLDRRTCSYDCIADGVWLFVIGLAKKTWIADTLAPVAEAAFDSGQSVQCITAWTGTLCYTFQLYFDFSGYSDMARGLGLMLGFRFPVNFDSPYKSASLSEFWNRWHITLSHFLRDYLYIPLGGSRTSTARTLRNLGITMLLGGLWHGAAWNFIAWGAYHGLLLIINSLWRRLTRWTVPRMLAIPLTFAFVMAGWVLFRAQSLGGALDMFASLAGAHGIEPFVYHSVTLGVDLPAIYGQFGGAHGVAFLALVAALAFFAPNSQQLPKPRNTAMAVVLAAAVLGTITTFMQETPFLYFQF